MQHTQNVVVRIGADQYGRNRQNNQEPEDYFGIGPHLPKVYRCNGSTVKG